MFPLYIPSFKHENDLYEYQTYRLKKSQHLNKMNLIYFNKNILHIKNI